MEQNIKSIMSIKFVLIDIFDASYVNYNVITVNNMLKSF